MLQAIAYPVFLIGCLLGVVRPSWALALIVTMYAAEQLVQAAGGIFLSISPLANFMVAGVGGIAALRLAISSDRPFLGYFNAQWFGTLALFAWSMISLAWTPSYSTAFDLTNKGLPYFVLFILIAPILVRDADDVRRTLWAILVFGVPVAVGLIANPEVRSSSGRLGVALSATARTSPLAIGDHGGVLIIIAALFLPRDRSGASTLLRAGGLLLGLALALMSGSRGQVLFAVLISMLLFPLARSIRNLKGFLATALGILTIGAAVYFIAPIALDRFGAQRWDVGKLEEGATVRLQNAMVLVEAQAERPVTYLTGLGFNAFSAYTPSATEPYSHNVALDIFSELGLAAFALYASIIWRAVSDCRRLMAMFANDPLHRSAIAAAIGLALFFLLLSLKQGNLWATGPLFMMLIVLRRLRLREECLLDERLAAEPFGDSETCPREDEGESRPFHDRRDGTVTPAIP